VHANAGNGEVGDVGDSQPPIGVSAEEASLGIANVRKGRRKRLDSGLKPPQFQSRQCTTH
jgi:hypothetical protein